VLRQRRLLPLLHVLGVRGIPAASGYGGSGRSSGGTGCDDEVQSEREAGHTVRRDRGDRRRCSCNRCCRRRSCCTWRRCGCSSCISCRHRACGSTAGPSLRPRPQWRRLAARIYWMVVHRASGPTPHTQTTLHVSQLHAEHTHKYPSADSPTVSLRSTAPDSPGESQTDPQATQALPPSPCEPAPFSATRCVFPFFWPRSPAKKPPVQAEKLRPFRPFQSPSLPARRTAAAAATVGVGMEQRTKAGRNAHTGGEEGDM
jgi:hypothetical protein